jgi:hypothetical protein
VHHDHTGAAVDYDGVAVSRTEHIVAERRHHGDVERAGDDRSMRRRRPLGERDAEDESLLEPKIDELRRPEVTRNDDRRIQRRLGRALARECAHSAPAELAYVGGARREQRIVERFERSGMPLRHGPQRLGRRPLGGERLDFAHERRIGGHQPARRDDLRLGDATAHDEALLRPGKLPRDAPQRLDRSLGAAPARRRDRIRQYVRRSNVDSLRDDDAAKLSLAHCSAATACSSARRMITVEVAPGSW